MPALKPLTGNIREGVYNIMQLVDKQLSFQRSLKDPRHQLENFLGNRKDFSSITKYFDAAEASLEKAIQTYRQTLRKKVRDFFGKQGMEVGAVVELSYPVYQLSIGSVEDDNQERLTHVASVTLKVESFSIQRALSMNDVVLNVLGFVKKKNGQFSKDFEAFRLEPGYDVRVIKKPEQ